MGLLNYKEWMRFLKIKIVNFIANNIFYITILIILLIWMMVITISKHQWDLFFHGSFTIFTAVIAAILAIHKYHSEQRINRLQKLYFEDVFMGMMKNIENTLSETNKNMMSVESLYNLSINLLENFKVLNQKKKSY